MSPVPPAMSRIFHGVAMEVAEGPVVDVGGEGEKPGLRERTKWSFQRRWMPRDMRSFMVS